MQILNVEDWISAQENGVQFKVTEGYGTVGWATCVTRLKDNLEFAVKELVIFDNDTYKIWYFHPDMKSVELDNYKRREIGGIIAEINDIKKA